MRMTDVMPENRLYIGNGKQPFTIPRSIGRVAGALCSNIRHAMEFVLPELLRFVNWKDESCQTRTADVQGDRLVEIVPLQIPDVLLLRPKVFADRRGFFLESYNQKTLGEAGFNHSFVQDNHSHSQKGVLRGLHYQVRQPQGKLIRVVVGKIFDVAVDVRRTSAHFGKWVARRLSADNKEMLWVPPGFAHGFLVLSETADVLYKATDYYAPQFERTLLWNDPDLGIDWPLTGTPVMSEKDMAGKLLKQAEL
jgi:dTDP-4-dehydrorhamnose 3,5-epimerase